MATSPNESTYLLYSPDASDLPNSRVLEASASTGLVLEDTGPAGTLTVATIGNLATLYNYTSTGYMVYNHATRTFLSRALEGSDSVLVTSGDGIAQQTQFSVIPNTTNQQVQVELNGLLQATRKTINLIPQSHISITVDDNGSADRADVYFNVTDATTGTVTSVGMTSPDGDLDITGSPITTAGTFEVKLANQPLLTAGTYFRPEITVNEKGILTNVVEGSGPGPGGNTVVNVTPNMSPYYVTPNDFMINVTALSPEVQMEIVLPAVNNLLVGKQYYIKDSSGMNTTELYTKVTVAGETEVAYSVGGTGTLTSSGESSLVYNAHGVDVEITLQDPCSITFNETFITGPEVVIYGNIDNTLSYNITNPYGSLSVIGINDPPNTWAIV